MVITTVANAYGWLVLQPATEALDLNVRTSELFGSSLVTKLTSGSTNNQIIDYNHTSSYNRNDLAFVLSRSQINQSNFNLTIDVNINAHQNIKVRVKTLEMWIDSTGRVVNNPNAFNITYSDQVVEDTNEIGSNYFYGPEFYKDVPNTLKFITGMSKKTSYTVPTTISEVRIVVIVSGVQSNRDYIWEDQIQTVKTLTVTGSANQQYGIDVDFSLVANEMYQRGLAIEFISGSFNAVYLWHPRTIPTSRKVMLNPGTYQVKINSVNHLTFSTVQNGNNINLDISYNPNLTASTWGYEDTIYGPSTISIYNQQNPGGYKTGDIVYYIDPNGTNTGYYIAKETMRNYVQPVTATHYWRKMSVEFQGGQYYEGDVIFHNGYFWIAIQDNYTTPPSWGSWQILDRAHIQGSTYVLGDVVYTTAQDGTKTYYYANATNGLANAPATWNGWRKISNQYDSINIAPNNYIAGEIVLHQGNYYRALTSNEKWETPSPSANQQWTLLTFPVYTNKAYAANSTVTYNGARYYARSAISINQTPGISGAWQELTTEWRSHNVYSNNVIKTFINIDDKLFQWRGTHNTNSSTAPGTERNGWHEITNIWIPTNIYQNGEFVIYDGSFWQLITDDPYPTGVQSVPGVDFNIWKEYQIDWDPNRN